MDGKIVFKDILPSTTRELENNEIIEAILCVLIWRKIFQKAQIE